MNKLLRILAFLAVLVIVVGCKKTEITSMDKIEQKTVIKFFTNLPDRSSGQGLLEQILIENYMVQNQNVEIEIEALQDEPYKQKFQSYAASNRLPDLVVVWGQPSFLQAIMEGNYVAQLDPADYEHYDFFEGSTNDFSYKGKLYGLPRGQDSTVLYYNRKLFEDAGVKPPTTYDELLEAAKIFRAEGIAPIAINGTDKWILNLFFQDLVVKVSGSQATIYDAIDQKTQFISDPDIRKAVHLYKDLVVSGLFQDDFTSADYGTAQNLFLQGKAAMYYMGTWEIGMASNKNNADIFKSNVAVIPFPIVEAGKGLLTDLVAWNGGGYAVSAGSKVKEEAIKLLNYLMEPENWAKNGWSEGVIVPAQDYSAYLTGNENQLQASITEIIQGATSMSGTPWNDYAPSEWKTNCENLMLEFSVGIITVDEFLKGLDEATDLE